jgi:beta-lactamase class D
MKTDHNGSDMFWVVSPAIRTTPEQQYHFIGALYHNSLPFSKKNIENGKAHDVPERNQWLQDLWQKRFL